MDATRLALRSGRRTPASTATVLGSPACSFVELSGHIGPAAQNAKGLSLWFSNFHSPDGSQVR